MANEGNGGEPAKEPTTKPTGATTTTPEPTTKPTGATTTTPANSSDGIGVILYKLALAGVGAVMLAQEELEAAWKKRASPSGEGGAEGAEAQRPETPKNPVMEQAAAETKAQIDGTIGRVLRSLSIPTRDDVEAIDKRIDAITARMDALGI